MRKKKARAKRKNLAAKKRQRYSLDELIAQIDANGSEIDRSWITDKAVGRELI